MCSWVYAYLDEHSDFPYSKYNDQVDTTSQALKFLEDQVIEVDLPFMVA